MRVFIHGSCVSRDLLTVLQQDGFALSFYSPRQSLIGPLAPASGIIDYADTRRLTSRFQRRALEGTLTADVLHRLEKHAPSTDMVLWDLVDERLGAYEYRGTYVTRSLELMSTGLDEQLRRSARHISFGNDEHFALWSHGLQLWRDALKKHSLLDRVILLAPPWADTFTNGQPTPRSYGISAYEHSTLAARYYAAARAAIPALRVVGRDVRTFGSLDHQWGTAPFHFGEATNSALADELYRVTHYPESAFPPPFPVIEDAGDCHAVVRTSLSWGDSIAVHILKGSETIARTPYSATDKLTVEVPNPGRYRFRVFHMSGTHRVGVTTPLVAVT